MSILNFKPAVPEGDPRHREDKPKEKVFLEQYSWLVDCALGITHGQREHAEDLVHDTFVQFLAKDIDVDSIANIRWYLNGILRNLHLLQLRRATRHPVQQFSIFDHDSASIGLRAWTSADQLESANSLVRACDFACYRKETSLSASILILRYFHGYYPGEICLLLGARRKVIYRWIDRGRNETKEYMESPYPLPSCGDAEPKAAPSIASANTFLRRLRERIFDSCLTGCLVLTDNPKELGVTELAHLVSCRACLDRRSRKMGLAHVAQRMADDISDRDEGGPRDGSGGTTGEILALRSRSKPSKGEILRRAYARKRELFEHRPKEISLAFDGQLRATLLINSSTNALNLSLDSKEVPNSIAVLGEQEFYFLILDQDDLKCPERRVHHVPLSDDRLLEVVVTPETLGPSIQVIYQDPLLLAETSGVEDRELFVIAAENQVLSFSSEQPDSILAFDPAWWTAFSSKLRNLVLAMNPLLTSAIVFSALALACFVFWMRSGPSIPAGELLDRAQKSEQATVSTNRSGVIYEKVSIRTQHRTVERTIYRDAQGVRHPRRQHLSPEDERLKDKLSSAGVDWDAPLSAIDYGAWRHRSGATRDEVTRSGEHLLTLTTTPLIASTVLKETLTVRDTDFHTVDRTVELRDNGTVEVAELNYDVLPWGAVNQDWFEPLSGAPHSDTLPPSLLPRLPGPEQLDLAELQARLVLNRLHADSTEELEFVRSESGVEVKGIVESDARKRELASALRMIPDIRPAIFSVEELHAHADANGAVSSIRAYSTVAQPSPLEQLFRAQGRGTESLNAISQQLFDATLSVGQESRALDELNQRFGNGSQLDDAGRRAFQQLLEAHATRLRSAADAEDAVLTKAGLDHSENDSALTAPGRLDAAAANNMALCKELISGKADPQRSAPVIAEELYRATQALRDSLHSINSNQSSSSQALLPDSEKR
jgi:DNA-directed RNA polymerase specialized sigma24 family protein